MMPIRNKVKMTVTTLRMARMISTNSTGSTLRFWWSSCLARGHVEPGSEDGQEIARFEAGASNQSPVNIRRRQELRGVVRLDAPSVLDNDAGRGRLTELCAQPAPNESMSGLSLLRRRRQAGADRPDRLISQHGTRHL